MEYQKIISVSGLGGLYELVASKTDGAIVRSLEDKTTRFIATRVHTFSQLETIEIFTTHENVNLADVLKEMQQSSETLPNEKDAGTVKKYFEKIYPSIDFDRVYNSDLKKIVRWFSILKKNDIEIKLSAPAAEEEIIEVATTDVVEEIKSAEEAPKKKSTKKKAGE